MHLSFLVSIFILPGILHAAKTHRNTSRCRYSLLVVDDGPVTLDVPVTISAQLNCAKEHEEYLYKFEVDIDRTVSFIGQGNISASFLYKSEPGERSVRVTAYRQFPFQIKLAEGITTFEVTEYIPGDLQVSGVLEDNNALQYIATGRSTNLSVQLSYPQYVLQDSEFSYSWKIGDDHFTTRLPFKHHRFSAVGPQWVRASVVARIPSYDGSNITLYKWGYFGTEIIVKDPFTNLNITGNTYLQHGQLLDLEISCSGSGPLEYCWKILPPTENHTNLSCSDPVSATECSFPILYYFRDSGDFLLAIYADNLVSSLQRNVEIHIYDVSLRPQLSTVIIPVVCTVLVVLIVAGAVVAHVRRHSTYDIETADFDFMRPEESYTVTSWELMSHSLLQLVQLRRLFYASEGGSTLMNYGAAAVPGR